MTRCGPIINDDRPHRSPFVIDFPAREEGLTLPEPGRFCDEVFYYHIMLRSTHLADPTTVLALDRKEPNESRL